MTRGCSRLQVGALPAQHLDMGRRIHSGRFLVALCLGLIVPVAGLEVGAGCGGKAVVDGAMTGTGGGAGTGGTTGTSTSIASGGGSPMSCDEIDVAYLEQVALAKACSVELQVTQCTLQLDSDLACPCPTYVNPANAAAVSMLTQLRTAWNAQSCPGGTCDAGLCPVPDGEGCMPQGPGSGPGMCTDMFSGG
jgi:hypothetical protein